LRAEIVAAARELLAAAPSAEDVSIRAVADAVGVTPPSIYLHFADKNELLGAVVAAVFEDLDQAMLAAGDGITEPMQRLRAYGLAYVRFAVSHPQHYRIAAMDPCPRPDVDTVLADGAFQHFAAVVRECMDAGLFTAGDPMRVTLELWAAAHGIASLMIAKPFLPWGDPEEVADRVLCAAAMGHVALGQIDGDPHPAKVTSWLELQQRRARRRAAQ
jgi:AcrR family transcriptional regulator